MGNNITVHQNLIDACSAINIDIMDIFRNEDDSAESVTFVFSSNEDLSALYTFILDNASPDSFLRHGIDGNHEDSWFIHVLPDVVTPGDGSEPFVGFLYFVDVPERCAQGLLPLVQTAVALLDLADRSGVVGLS